ncbi:LRR receptor-like serine/threonine-protein kinase EFR [Andrographis paniculata]|uniref:LRR receptor-like serine/threonine-protein kinase EFR n=1 Tax=Andrographis paniculata TaxID=175694 RepID=UPI0021E7854D|nr:LRR receptor-like serine/threonine-protein kinase EFR [Andrographis paniculata]
MLDLRDNDLTGVIPPNIGNLHNLDLFTIEANRITGLLPKEFSLLQSLEEASLAYTSLSGMVEAGIFNMSTLRILTLSKTGMAGSLPSNIFYGLPAIEALLLDQNDLTGEIPHSLSNCSNLKILALSSNEFTGSIPHSFGNLRLLERLQLANNNLRIESSTQELSFITSLANCKFLTHLEIAENPLMNGDIPSSIGNLSSLQNFNALGCRIKGVIPAEIGNLSELVKMRLDNNELTGEIPFSVKQLHKLQGLYLVNNKMGGSIEALCNVLSLAYLGLSKNRFSGPIPECLGHVASLRVLFLDSNMLTSSIPLSLWSLRDILLMELSGNSLSGFIAPEIGNLVSIGILNLSMNNLSGSIPSTIGKLENINVLSLGHNELKGSIPMSMGSMIGLENLDLSYNKLSGPIPKSLEALRQLNYFNVSFNSLTGEIPSDGPFRNFTGESFKANKGLCGIEQFHVTPCSRLRRRTARLAIFISCGATVFIIVVLACIFIVRYRKEGKERSRFNELMPVLPERVSYYELLKATEELNENNLLGVGSFGSVYKVDFGERKILAVKVFNLQSESAFNSFDVECEVLRSIRHRNLTKVLGSCSNKEFKALILEYMPNGNLEKWLHSQNDFLDVSQRLNIMIDVASAMEYLHHGCSPPIVHCDLKPSNILLDVDMVAHVSDFGIAKLLGDGDSVTLTNTFATLGYIAPEYGLEGIVSTRPSDEMFQGVSSLKNWVEDLIPKSLDETTSDVINVYIEHSFYIREFEKKPKASLDTKITSMGRIRMFVFRILLLLVLVIISKMPCPAATSTNIATDQSALLALKTSITSDPLGIITTNWTDSSSVCSWIGVTCSIRHHRVAALNISYMGVTGTIPPHLGNLSFLVSLDLGYNSLGVILPQELSKLHRLKTFSLGVNNFSGEIPSWIGHLPKLEVLSLENNSFTGSIPTSISNLTSLVMLDCSHNPLQGTIPEELGYLRSLQFLSLVNNQLSGPIPLSIFNLSSLKGMAFTFNQLNGNLDHIDICRNLPFLEKMLLSYNRLTGQIPLSLSKCSTLKSLSVSSNFFMGEIPKELCKIQSLEGLYLGFNMLRGVIPEEIGMLQNLRRFGVEGNRITGTVPLSIFNISSLQTLHLGYNNFSGTLPRDIGNLTMLQILNLSENNFTGDLPQEIGKLNHLEYLAVDNNNFICSTSHWLFNISTLVILSLSRIDLGGSLPSNFGYKLPLIEELYLERNNLSGAIPASISNCSNLRIVSLAGNKLSGVVPLSFGGLRNLEGLYLFYNNLRFESSSSELSFITSLTNCRRLKYISISYNPLGGIIPSSVGNLSKSLQNFEAVGCDLKGSIPAEIGNLSSLVTLALPRNALTGNILHSVEHLNMLQGLYLDGNSMRGSVPEGLCNSRSLVALYLNKNEFSGPIPDCLGNLTSLKHLHLDANMMISSIPPSIWQLYSLLELTLSKNSFSGFLPPEISNLTMINTIDLSGNRFSGEIPETVVKLQTLGRLYLDHNNLGGSIPVSMGSMINLEVLDLSYNNLSGTIPPSLQDLQYLKNFNVSFNALTGEIPSGGAFGKFNSESFIGNEALCGIDKFHVPPCGRRSKSKSMSKKVKLALIIAAAVIALVTAICFAFIFLIRHKRKVKEIDTTYGMAPIVPERFSYYDLLRATENFGESNLLGIGSFGSVYKGDFGEGKILAVKVFNLQSEASFKSFDVECEVLRSIRHRNLTKIMGSCSNEEFKALVLEYMPNGSLEKWLYSDNHCLNVEQRLNIMIDVASALEYLHHGYSTPIVHCDLKPNNVLLDVDLVAHVSDFGISKLLSEEESIVHTNTLATLGYIAPEYGLEGLVSTRCDVYSFGIMLMETFTRRRPSDEMFRGDLSLKNWVEDLLPESLDEIVDANLLNPEDHIFDKALQCVVSVFELSLKCAAEHPTDRMNMKDVLVELNKIKGLIVA